MKKFLQRELKSDIELAKSLLGFKVTQDQNQELLQNLVQDPLDPFEVAALDLDKMNSTIIESLRTEQSTLDKITGYYFQNTGKCIRPTTMLLLARAISAQSEEDFYSLQVNQEQELFSQVIEMIHASSLIHDDVIDEGEIRRGKTAIHKLTGNKAAILGGDYIIATASYMCASLGKMPLMHIISDIMENLSKGELIQKEIKSFENYDDLLQIYVNKTYFKTAALIAHGCKGIGLLHSQNLSAECFEFGKHIGLAFQYIDDVLDFTSSSDVLGKPAMNDMKCGLATGPVILPGVPDFLEIINRKFEGSQDIETGAQIAADGGIEITKYLAIQHLIKALKCLPFSPFSKRVLASLGYTVLTRDK